MKAHISSRFTEAGGKPLCGSRVSATSGFSASLTTWRDECQGWQCEKCAAALAKAEAKMAAKAARA